jgi:transposase
MNNDSTGSSQGQGHDAAREEWRRLHALHLKEFAWRQRDIAIALAVPEAAVSQWLSAARAGGATALHCQMKHGRSSRLTPEQPRPMSDFL